ncbi:Oxysterol-binding protein [Cynara cardunculus var. scolymus]|uniref:Oxysterol-binding protein n=1 Tax=Cynara cardunculus var. scolymus TaxID=59895 RepID=A0A103XB22_CYNCS|nr:Oxysterol-binding protein [Cynara cardunculus var. scolymus]
MNTNQVNQGTIENGGEDSVAVLTPPLSLDCESGTDYRAPNLLHRILALLKNVRPGSDLTRFSLPPIFNIPKSQLQCYGESVYCVNSDMLTKCANGETPLERFISVVAWTISTLRPLMFGVAPYNPILGETHHVSRGNLNVLLEQVSHHPPVTALHATNEKDKIEMTWCQYAIPKFYGINKDSIVLLVKHTPYSLGRGQRWDILGLFGFFLYNYAAPLYHIGTSIETQVLGKRQLKLLNNGETYVMNSPNLVIKFLPVPDVEWLGNVTVRCQETGLEAELCFKGTSFLGRRGNYRSIKGKILSSMKTIYEISGHWDRTVTIKDISNGKMTVIYRAKDVISAMKTPVVKDVKSWDKAKDSKTAIEDKERELVRNRISKGEAWVPNHFVLSNCKQETGEWEWEWEDLDVS